MLTMSHITYYINSFNLSFCLFILRLNIYKGKYYFNDSQQQVEEEDIFCETRFFRKPGKYCEALCSIAVCRMNE